MIYMFRMIVLVGFNWLYESVVYMYKSKLTLCLQGHMVCLNLDFLL